MMKSIVGSIVVAFAAMHVAAASEYSKVNGSVTVAAGETVASASTVNGSIRIGERAKVGEVETVNGSVTLGAGATAASLETVNGSVEIGDGAQVTADVETVNGRLRIRNGAVIGGSIENVNGDIDIAKAQIKGGITTIAADLTLGAEARVDGAIRYRKPRMSWGANKDVPRIVIGPQAVVGGNLIFEREVVLYVSDTAKIGQVTGAKPIRFTGATPPG